MATLQKLRNKGSLLIAFVGIALFAFIAGDIVKLFQKAPEEPTVGTINGEAVKVSDFYAFRNQCEQAYTLMNNGAVMDENTQEEITQMAWSILTNYKSLTAQAQNAGITVTPEELSYILSTNWGGIASQYTRSLPQEFSTQTGAFNIDFINEIITEYNNYKESGAMPEELAKIHDAWKFIETSITCDIINQKMLGVFAFCSATPNQAVAKRNFNLNDSKYTAEIAAYPYSNFANSQVTVSDEEIANYYETNKETLYKVPFNLYDVAYINHEIKPTKRELDPLDAEFKKYATALQAPDAKVEDIAIFSSTECPYDGYLWTIDGVIGNDGRREIGKFKDYHKTAVLENRAGKVSAPFESKENNTYNLVKTIREKNVPDSIKFRFIVIQSASAEELNATTDSLLKALNNNIDFNKIAENYAADTVEFKTKNFAELVAYGLIPTPEVQEQMYTATANTYNVAEPNANTKVIYQVMSKKGEVKAYDAFIIERKIPISIETYNNEYNQLSQFVTSNKDYNELQKNILTTSYNLQQQQSLNANSKNIDGIPGTRELLRWALGGRTVGEISNIHEYMLGNKKYLMVAAIKDITPKGYASLDKVKESIRQTLIDEKKAELIAAEMKGKSFNELRNNSNVKIASTENIEYKKATSVQSINADEFVISAAVANMNIGETSAPIKGDNGVYVVRVISKEAKNSEFSADTEADYIQSMDFYGNPNFINMLIQESINNGNNVDNRIYEHM